MHGYISGGCTRYSIEFKINREDFNGSSNMCIIPLAVYTAGSPIVSAASRQTERDAVRASCFSGPNQAVGSHVIAKDKARLW